MIYIITLVFCLHGLMHINESLNHDGIQQSKLKDLVKEDLTEFYGSNEIYPDELGKSIKLWKLEASFILVFIDV